MSNALRKIADVHPKPLGKVALSKSRFCVGVQCVKALYLSVYERQLAAPVDAAQQKIFDQGTEVGFEARKRYPSGLLIDWDHRHQKEALQATKDAIAHNPTAIFEAAFTFHDTLVRIDILKNNGDGTWDLIEVKSSTELKDEHIPDIAIQRYVAEGAGLKITQAFLKHINRECIYPNLENLFVDVNCTDRVDMELKTVPDRIDQMLTALGSKAAPKVEIGPHCSAPHECGFKGHCWNHIPEHSVFELNGVWDKTKFELYRRGLVLIKNIPENEKVSRAKPQQIMAVRSEMPVTDSTGLKKFLDQIEYPISFFDFETLNPAIPQYEGLHPYSQYPFQFSCHIIDQKGAEPKHVEYLADGKKDPRPEIGEHLLKALGSCGTIIAYHAAFEKSRIEELANQFPSMRNALLALLPRFVDLKDAFSSHYYHPDFHGSFSLKDVLPVIVPSMTYDGMDVGNGGIAQVAYMKICSPNASVDETTKCRNDLLAYCKQDTLAMVKLWNELYRLAKG